MDKRETINREYKRDLSKTYLKTISAFANYGDGEIIFGIDDERNVVGVENLEESCLKIENTINDSIQPIPKYSLEIDEKDKIITLKVYEGQNKPYLYKNKAYKRHDSSTIEVDRLDFGRLILEGQNQSYEELPAFHQELQFNILEEELIDELQIKELNKDILKTLNLYSDREGFNRAAEILADTNNYPGVDIVEFGDSIDEFTNREHFDRMSALKQFKETIGVYRRKYQYEVVEGSERILREKIPEKAFREALANSIVHRAWDINSTIKISMFKDKVEITSPGGLPSGMSEEEYLHGQISLLRNPILGNVFFRLKYIEQFGTGIRRINQAYTDNIIKPEFIIYDNSITVSLPILSQDTSTLPEEEKQIYNLLKKQGTLSRKEIEDQVRFNKYSTIRLLNSLINLNIIERIGHGRGTKYRLK